jgi:hypothetical protein
MLLAASRVFVFLPVDRVNPEETVLKMADACLADKTRHP